MKTTLLYLGTLLLSVSVAQAGILTRVANFGDNPGRIEMHKYVPRSMPPNAPLVVSLHGCLQDAEIYSNVGWTQLADQWKFYVVFPEQAIANNAYRCWNWFQQDDTRRGRGEIESIAEMVEKMKTDYSINTRRVYIEGLSAGGWMVPVILASYPDVFAGGATNAGGPAFCASTRRYFWDLFGWWQAYEGALNAKTCMNGKDYSPRQWGNLVRKNGYDGYHGPWPVLSIWQGTADGIVDRMNQQELVDQWTSAHGIDLRPDKEETIDPGDRVTRREYHDGDGKVLVETYLIRRMAHGTPIAVDSDESCGETGPYILDEGICAVRWIGLFWDLNQ
jgi:poly(hydroxyalkanoate) depolymerase family esterase